MNLQASPQTEDDFNRARNKAFFNEIQHLLNPEEVALISLNDIKHLIKPSAETYKGMQVIPVEKIVGSEGRYKDFDNKFFPKSSHLKTRWQLIDDAAIRDITLPPIKVYEISGVYFVRDGNHRVSVAKSRGTEFIDAEVVVLQSEIKLKNPKNWPDIIHQIINYEKRNFYAETNFGDITDFWCLDFTTPGKYDVIYNHILTHKYFINMDKEDEISMEDAISSWYQNVYCPVVHYIEDMKIMKKFKKRTVSDLYVYILKYWQEMRDKFGDIPLEDAIHEYTSTHKEPLKKKFANYFNRIILRKALNNNVNDDH